jgi:succinate dehydrogenase / fumarate reductase cytochrome b subunit
MSNSVLFKSSIGKKVFMALTGLFLCTFLVGHLLGNLQLILKTGEEGRRAFNEYAYFMGHNPFIKILSYVTYAAVLIHIIDGFALTIQNRKARPVRYAYNKPAANSSSASRSMAILGTLILVFLATHMANFWWKMKVKEDVPLHVNTVSKELPQLNPVTQSQEVVAYNINHLLTTSGEYLPVSIQNQNTKQYFNSQGMPVSGADTSFIRIKNVTEIYNRDTRLKMGEAYKDLHGLVIDFFSKTKNEGALFAVLFYVISMIVLGYHLLHGFQSAFQSLGINHPKYNPLIKIIGTGFAVVVPFLFAIIPVIIYMNH